MSAATAVRRSVPSSNSDIRMRNNSRGADHTSESSNSQAHATPPSSPVHESARPSRGCCFCCLAVKSSNGGADKSRDNKLTTMPEKDEPPTLEELKLWGESFEKLMKCSGGRKLFREFLRSEYSEENMLFYLACEDLKKEDNPELIEEKARLIYEDYISILSPKEVSLDSRVREVINRNMVEPTPHTFDEAQLQIWTLMHRDSYPRFLNSQVYKRLLQQLS
ncbi:regulator of G-protein signaling rgs-2-like isoform X2 [Biomphalaria glabrata]|nr:regulator of G-protein signaling rgs-2-like isoform X2 [Biomphalaria glabrata]XP_055885534.1 regulator of G-protein signaling rgs-2-like isoform X2 [Biomphalaria glabrata]XP_055885535.1 regulator of G-protein signaling rgs-2-like isoform X2 [Biomphalaria glabrata]